MNNKQKIKNKILQVELQIKKLHLHSSNSDVCEDLYNSLIMQKAILKKELDDLCGVVQNKDVLKDIITCSKLKEDGKINFNNSAHKAVDYLDVDEKNNAPEYLTFTECADMIVNDDNTVSVILEATVHPEQALNKLVDWSIAFLF